VVTLRYEIPGDPDATVTLLIKSPELRTNLWHDEDEPRLLKARAELELVRKNFIP
jgi:hypothetical protein